MQYLPIVTPAREALIALETTGWGLSCQELFDQTDASGYEVFLLESQNKFNNPYRQASEERHKQRGYWAQIFRDIVQGREKELGETPPGEGFVPVLYRAWAQTPYEVAVKTWKPINGLYAPVYDSEHGHRFFKPNTVMPEKVVSFGRRAEAEKAFRQFGLPLDYISSFYGPDDYKDGHRFVGRLFDPKFPAGRFFIYADVIPSGPIYDWVGSLPAHKPGIAVNA